MERKGDKSAVIDIWCRIWHVLSDCFSHHLLPHPLQRGEFRRGVVKFSCTGHLKAWGQSCPVTHLVTRYLPTYWGWFLYTDPSTPTVDLSRSTPLFSRIRLRTAESVAAHKLADLVDTIWQIRWVATQSSWEGSNPSLLRIAWAVLMPSLSLSEHKETRMQVSFTSHRLQWDTALYTKRFWIYFKGKLLYVQIKGNIGHMVKIYPCRLWSQTWIYNHLDCIVNV